MEKQYVIDAERAVLAAILLNEDNYDSIKDLLKANDFSSLKHAEIFIAFNKLKTAKMKIDVLSVAHALDVAGLLCSYDYNYLLELQEDIPSLGMIKEHALIVKTQASLRRHDEK